MPDNNLKSKESFLPLPSLLEELKEAVAAFKHPWQQQIQEFFSPREIKMIGLYLEKGSYAQVAEEMEMEEMMVFIVLQGSVSLLKLCRTITQ